MVITCANNAGDGLGSQVLWSRDAFLSA